MRASIRWVSMGCLFSLAKQPLDQSSKSTQVSPTRLADEYLHRQGRRPEQIEPDLVPDTCMPPHEQQPVAGLMPGILLAIAFPIGMADLVISNCRWGIYG